MIKRVAWQEGMLLRPQHFQQHQLMMDAYLSQYFSSHEQVGWHVCEINDQKLMQGMVCIDRAFAVLPSGQVLVINSSSPCQRMALECAEGDELSVVMDMKYQETVETAVVDLDTGQNPQNIVFHHLKPTIEVNSQAPMRLPLCRIQSVRSAQVCLEVDFLPPVARVHASVYLKRCLEEAVGLFNRQLDVLSSVCRPVVSKYHALLSRWQFDNTIRPWQFYDQLLMACVELKPIIQPGQRYQADVFAQSSLGECIKWVMAELRSLLSMMSDEQFRLLSIQMVSPGVASVELSHVLDDFPDIYLSFSASDMSMIHDRVKLLPPSQASQFVGHQVPGIPLIPMRYPPKALPSHHDLYAKVDNTHPLWESAMAEGRLLILVPSDNVLMPSSCWAMKEGTW